MEILFRKRNTKLSLIAIVVGFFIFFTPFFVEMNLNKGGFGYLHLEIETAYTHADNHTENFPGAGDAAETPATKNINANPSGIPDLCSLTNPKSWFLCFGEMGMFLTGHLLAVAGRFFDYMLLFTLDTNLLDSSKLEGVDNLGQSKDYINGIWSNIRDIANLGFIFALIYISFSLIFSIKAQQAKSLFTRVVLIALLLNFSLLITKVIIDAGNITALTFYNSIDAKDSSSGEAREGGLVYKNKNGLSVPQKGISGAFMQEINPSNLLKPEVFESMVTANGGNPPLGAMSFLLLSIAAINFLVAKELIIASFMFISRTVWLILLMVLSPLAFVSYLFPPTQKYFSQWFKAVIDRSFCIVIFLFFLWLLIQLVAGMNDFLSINLASSGGADWRTILLGVGIQFGIAYTLLKLANAETIKRCDGGTGIGAMVVKGVNGAAGAITGGGLALAGGGAGVALRSSIGAAGYKAAESKTLSRMATSRGKLYSPLARLAGNATLGLGDKAADAKFGRPEGAAARIDRRKDLVKKQMNRDANNLERKAKDLMTTKKDKQGNIIRRGLSEPDARKQLGLDLNEGLNLKEAARGRASKRATKSGIFGSLAAGTIPLITPNIADREAGSEFNKQTTKDAEKRWKTKRVQEEKEKNARAAAIDKASLDTDAKALANQIADTPGQSASTTINTKEFKASFDEFMANLASTFETDAYDPDTKAPIIKDGVQQKTLNDDAKAQIETIRTDLLSGFKKIADDPSQSPDQDKERLNELLSSKTKIGKDGIDGGLRAAQNMAAIEVENILDETGASIASLETDRAIDQGNLTMDADLIKQDPGSAKRAIAKQQKEERKAQYAADFAQQPVPAATAPVAGQSAKDKKTALKRFNAQQKVGQATLAALQELNKNTDQLESLMGGIGNAGGTTSDLATIENMFANVPRKPDMKSKDLKKEIRKAFEDNLGVLKYNSTDKPSDNNA